MKYEERVGESKLRILSDGVRFLKAIIEGVLCYRPERLFLMVFTLFLLIGALMSAYPIEYYWHNRRVEEWMIYRFVACFLLGSVGFLLLCAAVLSNRMAALGPKRRGGDSFGISMATQLFHPISLTVFSIATVVISVGLVWPGIVEYITTRQITLHWSRIIVGAFGLVLLAQALVTAVLLQLVELWKYQRSQPFSPDQLLESSAVAAVPVEGLVARGEEVH